MKKLLTIVVPVYKVEPYINKCLDSCILKDEKLMSQLEVIIVNDGTPDNSAEMSREYVKRYPKTFRQIDKENGGHGSAWNVGLKEATGKYLRFLDSDDWLTNLDKLMEKLQETDADLIFTHMNIFWAYENRNEKQEIIDEYDVSKPFLDFDFTKNTELHTLDFWSTTYKLSILQYGRDLFIEHVMYDDGILFILPAIKAQTYVCYDFVVYNYFVGRADQSKGQEKKIKSIRDRYQQGLYMHQFLEEHKEYISNKIYGVLSSKVREYIRWFFFDLVLLPYTESKDIHSKCYSILKDNHEELGHSKVAKRFRKYPFLIFYTLEQIREYKRKLTEK